MKKRRGLKIFLIIVGVLAIFIGSINLIPPKKNFEKNPFVTGEVMLAAHRGGALTNPENTMKAFKGAVNDYNADIIETDIWMTKDNRLVFNHDGTLNRTTDIKEVLGSSFDSNKTYKIEDFTLDELRNFNYGYQFEKDGAYPYKDLVKPDTINRRDILKENDLSITELSEFFDYFYKNNRDLLFIIEIKNSGEKGLLAADMLYEMLETKYPEYLDNIILGTFHNEVEEYVKKNYSDIYRGASPKVATTFVITQLLCVNIFDFNDAVALQLPLKQSGISLTLSTFINRAHRRNIAVQYWTINNRKDMEMLYDKGVDAIMSDDVALLREVIDSKRG